MKKWMFQLVSTVNGAVNAGRLQLQDWHRSGVTASQEVLADYLGVALADYRPEINGRDLLGSDDRHHLTMALAGILIAVMDAETQEEAV